jgi:hypothetical protein
VPANIGLPSVCSVSEVFLSVSQGKTLNAIGRREGQARLVFQGEPWFYPRLVAYSYFCFSEGA